MSSPKDYTVGWICAVHTEYVAAQMDRLYQSHVPHPLHNETSCGNDPSKLIIRPKTMIIIQLFTMGRLHQRIR
jgi:hypothetical protein